MKWQLSFYHLLGNHVRQVFEGLLDGVLGHVPLEPGHVGGQIHSVGDQIFQKLLALILQHVAQVVGNFSGRLLNVNIKFTWNNIVRLLWWLNLYQKK